MEWAEIKRRLTKEGTSVQVLADLEAVPYKTMYNRIMAHQVKDGVTYLTPANTKGMKKAKAISDTKQKQAKEKEKAAGLPEDAKASAEAVAIMEAVPDGVKVEIRPEVTPIIVTNDYSCKGCAHCIQTSFGFLCKFGHECGENCVCSDYKAFPEKKKKVPDPGPAASINGVNLCKNCEMCQKDPAPFCKKFRYKLDGIVDYCSGYVSGAPEDVPKLPEVYEVEDETIEELNQLYFQCKQLAEKYQKQAEDWRRIMETCASWSNAKERKLPEGQ